MFMGQVMGNITDTILVNQDSITTRHALLVQAY